ncbi:ParB/RepB/Spo0J family partition protein [Selenomonas sp. AB3002]|uniref:ParB/RepB/Spo0J family partition protein n=1 Tax=Selenomonas sp. AB3002 TaxID=1392502 RepID=UPI000B15CE19
MTSSKPKGGLGTSMKAMGGQGLGALFGNTGVTAPAPENVRDKVQEIAVEEIVPNRYQPREEFDEAALSELTESVNRYGVLQPVLLRKLPDAGYELIAGERRLRAAKAAGLEKIPALVREFGDAEVSEIALIENLQREDLSVMEEARAYQRLIKDFGLKQEELSSRLGRSRSHIANTMRLLNLPGEVQALLMSGVLTAGQARPLLAIGDQELQMKAADYIQEHELSARQCEELAKRLAEEPGEIQEEAESKPAKPEPDIFLQEAAEKLKTLLGTQVQIKTGRKKSKVEIEFYSEEDLERILGLIGQHRAASNQDKIEKLRQFSQTGRFTV